MGYSSWGYRVRHDLATNQHSRIFLWGCLTFLTLWTSQFWSCACMLSRVWLCDPMDCSPPGSSVHGILQTRILEWLPFPSPGYLPDAGIKPWSPGLQADSLPPELSGKPLWYRWKRHSLERLNNLLRSDNKHQSQNLNQVWGKEKFQWRRWINAELQVDSTSEHEESDVRYQTGSGRNNVN